MDRIITLLRCSYKSLEITLEETPKLAPTLNFKPANQISANVAMAATGYISSSSSDGQAAQTRKKKKKMLKAPHASGLTSSAAATPVVTVSSSGCEEGEDGQQPTLPTSQFCRGPQWACPVRGHKDHDLANCQELGMLKMVPYVGE